MAQLAAEGPILQAQAWLNGLISSSVLPASVLQQTLSDVKLLAGRALKVMPTGELREWNGTVDEPRCRFRIDPERKRTGLFRPESAAQTAHAVSFAAAALHNEDRTEFVPILRKLMSGDDKQIIKESPSGAIRHWGAPSTSLQRKMLAALHTDLGPADALRYRTVGADVSVPTMDDQEIARRSRSIPQRFWPEWTQLLQPKTSIDAEVFQTALSIAALLPGYRRHAVTHLAHLLASPRRGGFSYVFMRLNNNERDRIIDALINLANYLDGVAGPIDYERRRGLTLSGLLSLPVWGGLWPRPERDKKRSADAARHYLAYRLTGSLTERPDSPHSTYYTLQNFIASTPTQVLGSLDEHAEAFLVKEGIAEPLSWEPPLHLLESQGAHDLQADPLSAQTAALVRRGLVDRRLISQAEARATKAAKAQRPSDSFEVALRSALDAGKSVDEMAKALNKSARMVRWHLARLGLPPSLGEKEWLDTQLVQELYLRKRRTPREIAEQTGWSKTTIRRCLLDAGVSLRQKGRNSGPTGIEADDYERLPALLRTALPGPHGVARLRRFAEVMTYRTLNEAVQGMGLNQPSLVQQLKNLEGDVGGELFIRAEAGPLHGTDEAGSKSHRCRREVRPLGWPRRAVVAKGVIPTGPAPNLKSLAVAHTTA
ncbi:LysR family transcriptional regulator [Arthrobacter sp. NPDC089319]|uniref:helix-turn-helix domain-containing protein n=1 Tax=Arthrobacter sp. NPDC089319 TaxID=3155915 RepID=UPI00341BF004